MNSIVPTATVIYKENLYQNNHKMHMVQLISQERLVSQAVNLTEFLNGNVQTVTKSSSNINQKSLWIF